MIEVEETLTERKYISRHRDNLSTYYECSEEDLKRIIEETLYMLDRFRWSENTETKEVLIHANHLKFAGDELIRRVEDREPETIWEWDEDLVAELEDKLSATEKKLKNHERADYIDELLAKIVDLQGDISRKDDAIDKLRDDLRHADDLADRNRAENIKLADINVELDQRIKAISKKPRVRMIRTKPKRTKFRELDSDE